MGVNGAMTVSAVQIAATKLSEGTVRDEASGLHAAYLDELATHPVWTIGSGHTTQAGITIHGVLKGQEYHGEEVVEGLLIDDDEADRLLKLRMERNAQIVREAVQVPLTQEQFDVLADMAHNLGSAPFRKGSDLIAALNGGVDDRGIRLGPEDYERAGQEILAWRNAGGRALTGLWKRRLMNAARWYGLPWQWIFYSSTISLDTSWIEVERMAKQYEDKAIEDLPERTTYVTISKIVEPYVEQAREAEKAKAKAKSKPAPVQTKPPSAYTRQPVHVAYKIDPNAGLKPLEESSRVHGYVWQQIGIVGLRTAGATGVAGASAVAADPELGNALLALFVVAGVGITATVIKSYGDWKRAKGEAEASQGLY